MARTVKPPWQKLSGDNIIEHLGHLRDTQQAVNWHFRTDSKLWKAIRNHIGEAKPGKCCIINKHWHCASHRGLGWAISLNHAFTYTNPSEKSFVLEFRVEFEVDDEDTPKYPKEVRRKYRLDVPKDLELNFTELKFQTWLLRQKRLLEAETKDEIQHRISEFIAQYPEARKFLKIFA